MFVGLALFVSHLGDGLLSLFDTWCSHKPLLHLFCLFCLYISWWRVNLIPWLEVEVQLLLFNWGGKMAYLI